MIETFEKHLRNNIETQQKHNKNVFNNKIMTYWKQDTNIMEAENKHHRNTMRTTQKQTRDIIEA